MFFDSWDGLLRVLLIGVAAYVALIVLLRVSGKRTLTKLNAFDLVVTVALGSTLATIVLNRDVALAEGVLALALLIFLQYLVTWLSVRWQAVRRVVASEPTLLLHEGEFLHAAMRRERVNEDEVRQALRKEGVDDPAGARAVVLESDGTFSVIAANR
ncbi:MAG TPA: YetF domain-containing protein [Lysobacter sp.]|nr:YetF domain-containing protein [Lysobacter sp.]